MRIFIFFSFLYLFISFFCTDVTGALSSRLSACCTGYSRLWLISYYFVPAVELLLLSRKMMMMMIICMCKLLLLGKCLSNRQIYYKTWLQWYKHFPVISLLNAKCCIAKSPISAQWPEPTWSCFFSHIAVLLLRIIGCEVKDPAMFIKQEFASCIIVL